MLQKNEIINIYQNIYSKADPFLVLRNDEPFKYLVTFLPNSLESIILDAGCGDGRYPYNLAKEGYKNIIGFDLLPEINTQGLFSYQCSSIDDINMPNSSVDFIYSLGSVVLYVPDLIKAYREIYRVLKPGSLFIFSAHTKYSLWTMDRKIKRLLGNAEHLKGIKFYSASEHCEMLKNTGFEVMNIDGYYPWYLPMDLSRKLTTKWHKLTYKSNDFNYFKSQKTYKKVPDFIKKMRSTFGYHLLIAVRKPE